MSTLPYFTYCIINAIITYASAKKQVLSWCIGLREALCWIQCVVIHRTQSNLHPSYRWSQFCGRSYMNCLLYVFFDHIIKTQTIDQALVSLKNSGVWSHLFLRWRTCEITVMFWQENKQPCICMKWYVDGEFIKLHLGLFRSRDWWSNQWMEMLTSSITSPIVTDVVRPWCIVSWDVTVELYHKISQWYVYLHLEYHLLLIWIPVHLLKFQANDFNSLVI